MASATVVKRFTPPSFPSTPSLRKRSRTDARGSTAWNRMPLPVSSSAMPPKACALCRSTRGAAERSSTTSFGVVGSARTRLRIESQTVHVEIDEPRFGPENQHAMNQFVVRMAGAIRETARSGDASQESDVWPRSAAQQLDQRNDRADKDTA